MQTSRLPNSASFIRPTAHGISYGTSFLNALFSRYIEIPHGAETQETVLLGSSNGAIEVEAVGLDKIRGKFSNLERLREVSLENQLVSRADDTGSIRKICPSRVKLICTTIFLTFPRHTWAGYFHKSTSELGHGCDDLS